MLVLILFYTFAAVLAGAAVGVITAKNPVFSALSLVLCFATSAAIWLLVEAEFLAIVLVLVYVGAVMVLFLFVVMMLDINLERIREGFWKNLWLALAVGLFMVAEMVFVIAGRYFNVTASTAPAADPAGGLSPARPVSDTCCPAACDA